MSSKYRKSPFYRESKTPRGAHRATEVQPSSGLRTFMLSTGALVNANNIDQLIRFFGELKAPARVVKFNPKATNIAELVGV